MLPEAVKTIPTLPGIYLFKSSDNAIIYVGKAKNLYKRVSSYFQKKDNDWKIKELIAEHQVVEHIVTKNETEALLLEAQLIRDYQPKYNTLLKAGNPYLYILFQFHTQMPTIRLVRTKKEKGSHFGPFLKKQDARRVFDYLVRTFKLMQCKVKIAQGCLEYHLGRCAGTCLENFDSQGYVTRLQLAEQALNGNSSQFLKTIDEQIKRYSKNLEFEKAAHLVGYSKNLETIFETIKTKFSENKYVPEITLKLMQFRRSAEDLRSATQELAQLLQLPQVPCTIDCFDISHFQSRYIVGACIRFTDGVPDKNKFRRFKIRSLTSQNDYAALQEIVSRRYKYGDMPDLIIIDGGKGQLGAVISHILSEVEVLGMSDISAHVEPVETCSEIKINAFFPQIISLAKREETVYATHLEDGIKLNLQSGSGQLIIAIRDYAHHFAIMYHKLLRSKEYDESRKVHHGKSGSY